MNNIFLSTYNKHKNIGTRNKNTIIAKPKYITEIPIIVIGLLRKVEDELLESLPSKILTLFWMWNIITSK